MTQLSCNECGADLNKHLTCPQCITIEVLRAEVKLRVNQNKKLEAQIDEALEYCKPHLQYMWAARISSIFLECDFKEVKERKYDQKNM